MMVWSVPRIRRATMMPDRSGQPDPEAVPEGDHPQRQAEDGAVTPGVEPPPPGVFCCGLEGRVDQRGDRSAAAMELTGSGRVVDKAERGLFSLPLEDNRRGRNGVA